ncbi:MAG: 1-acyl-sn-glycerol-3-phosphate acyltransferase [bacterium]|nr:1-acyl-sn-glycerol-3-phosphate acyltransferase [bacterium]
MGFLGRCLGTLLYRVEIEGLEHFPRSGPTLVLVKHQRNEDIPLGFHYVLTARRLDSWCIMKHDLAAPHLLGIVLKSGGIPIDRDRPMRSRRYFRMAREVLHAGRALVLFPEQTFFVNEMGPGKLPGFRYLTKRAAGDLQVVSVGLDYIPARAHSRLFDRLFGRFLKRTRAIFRISRPRTLSPIETQDQNSQAEFLHERMGEIARLTNLKYPHAVVRRVGVTKSTDI